MSQTLTDDDIVEIAARMVAEEGAGFTMERLAAAVGVSRATLYRRIPSREELAQRFRDRGIDPGPGLGGSTRERILDATREVIDAHQLRFTIEDVAERAQVGLATVYRIFGDREGLLRAFFARESPRRVATAQLSDLEAPVESTLRGLVSSLLRFTMEHPGLARIVLLDEGPDAREIERLRRGGRGTFAQLVTYFEAQIERGTLRANDPFMLASALVGMVLSMSLFAPRLAVAARTEASRRATPSADPSMVEERARQLVALLLRGAEASSEEVS